MFRLFMAGVAIFVAVAAGVIHLAGGNMGLVVVFASTVLVLTILSGLAFAGSGANVAIFVFIVLSMLIGTIAWCYISAVDDEAVDGPPQRRRLDIELEKLNQVENRQRQGI